MCEEIRIYVADLAACNNGKLHGVWINATDDLEDIQDEINVMLKNSPEQDSEEYAIHDYEGFAGYNLGEYEGIEAAHEIACFIEEHPVIGGEILNIYGVDLDDAKRIVEEDFSGCYKSLADYVQELTEETTEIPENLAYYIDYEKMGQDMKLNGEIHTIVTCWNGVHIFWNN